jgi:hypothetical protein
MDVKGDDVISYLVGYLMMQEDRYLQDGELSRLGLEEVIREFYRDQV